MQKQITAAILIMILFAGLGTSALLTRALAQPQQLSAIQQAKRIGPKPTPHWYWRWQAWRLGVGYAKGHSRQPSLRPNQAPRLIPSWSWRRLHFVTLARLDRSMSAKKVHGHTTTSTTTTATTTTGTTTTTPDTTTTTGTTTTTSSGGGTYGDAISYTQTPPPFAPTRTIDVSTASEFKTALSNLQAGDLVKATAPFTVTGETIISNRLSAPAELDLNGVSFVYSAGADLPAVWLNHASNIHLYGGDLSTSGTGGTCLSLMASDHILWWGFTAHDCGGSGLGMFTGSPSYATSGPVEYDDIQGEVWNFGQHPAWDNHLEKCTGLHGANLADSNYFPFDHNRVALYVHDSACEGAGIEFGSNQSTDIPTQNTIILKCVNLTFVSTIQTGGNCYQTWGYGNQSTDIQYLEADNLTGHAYFAGGLYNKPNSYLATDTVENGYASNVNQNPRYASDPVWDKTGGTAFSNVLSTP